MSPKNAAIAWVQDRLCLSGMIDANNVMSLYAQGVQLMHDASTIVCDCKGLSSSDSSILALMVEWIKYAQAAHKEIYFMHLSPEIVTIIHAAGLHSLIPMAAKSTCDA